MRPVRTALLGLGRMGRVHARALREAAAELEVVAVAEPDERLAAASESLLAGKVAVYAEAEHALEHDGVEACIVATPTPTHTGISGAALARGVHVFCEKPLALDPRISAPLERAARDAGRVLQVGFWRRHAEPWRKAKALIDAGEIGTPVMVRSSQWDAEPAPTSFCDPAVSGGLLVDLGVHDFDLIEWLSGERIEAVETRPMRIVEPELADVGDLDNALVLLSLSGGVTGLVDLSRNAAYGDDVRTEILGEAGAIFVETLPAGCTRVGTAHGQRTLQERPLNDVFHAGVVDELCAFAHVVRGVRAPSEIPSVAEDSRALWVALAARASASEGRPVTTDAIRAAFTPLA